MKTLAENRRAYHEYEILEKYDAGIELTGHEVKSAKSGKMSLPGCYVIFRGGEPYLLGAEIASFQPKNAPEEYDPKRIRKLLLQKKEIKHLKGKTESSSLTIVPLKAYNKDGFVKVQIALVRRKKKHDKREKIKKRDMEREKARELRRRMEQ